MKGNNEALHNDHTCTATEIPQLLELQLPNWSDSDHLLHDDFVRVCAHILIDSFNVILLSLWTFWLSYMVLPSWNHCLEDYAQK